MSDPFALSEKSPKKVIVTPWPSQSYPGTSFQRPKSEPDCYMQSVYSQGAAGVALVATALAVVVLAAVRVAERSR